MLAALTGPPGSRSSAALGGLTPACSDLNGRLPNVARLYIDRLSRDTYLSNIRTGLEYCRFGDLVSRSSRVFIKPNLTFPQYRPGVMTSPECIEAAVVAVKDYTDRIYIGDSDSGGYNPFPMEAVYRETGIVDLEASHGVKVVNLSRLPRTPIELRLGRRHVQLDMPGLLTDEIDLLITIPVPKIHMNTGVSLTFKNQWGCIPDPSDRLRLHPDFAQVILAVNRAVHARVAIVDGRYGLTRSGPMSGDAIELDWLMVSDDIGAAASVCCELMGVPLSRVRHLRVAKAEGWIPTRRDIETSQDVASFLAKPFYLHRRWTDYPGLFAFRSRKLAYLAYFSPLAAALHRVLYLFREPFYDYGHDYDSDKPPGDQASSDD
jgi:uncharacterized protein (DUF362 family)